MKKLNYHAKRDSLKGFGLVQCVRKLAEGQQSWRTLDDSPGEAQISPHYLRRITATNIKRKIKKVA
jgi:hypothetical protein